MGVDMTKEITTLKVESDKPCSECNGSRWRIWKSLDSSGRPLPLVRSCDKCNPKGDLGPPFYVEKKKKEKE